MNDEAAFVAAIAAAPTDHHLPLVFADWLDDRGDPRGQWLRNGYIRQWMPPTYENPIPKLLEALVKDKKVLQVRRAATAIGEPIVPGLVELLKHEKPRVRQQACVCLRIVGKPAKSAITALLESLGDSDSAVREQAAKAVKKIGTAGVVTDTDQLKAALTDENWNVRRAASKVLGSMKAKDNVLQELIEKFDSPDAADRKEVIEGLTQLGTADVIPTLDRALNDPAYEVREVAIEALGKFTYGSGATALCRAMNDTAAQLRDKAAGMFGRYDFTPEVITVLTSLLDDKVSHVRQTACRTLSRVDNELAPPLVPRIIALLNDPESEVQQTAIWALRDMAVGDKHALGVLIVELDNSDPYHRKAAVNAVGAVGRDDPDALAALLPLLGDSTNDVANVAVEALGQWKNLPASAAPALLARLALVSDNDQYGWETPSVLTALGRIESPPASVVEALRECVRNPPRGYGRTNAIRAIAELGPAAEAAVLELVALIGDEGYQDYYLHQEVVAALVRVGSRGLNELVALLDGTSNPVRWRVVNGLHGLGAAALPLLPALLRLYHRPTDNEWRRGEVLNAIQNLGPGASVALPDLLAAIEADGPAHVRANAIRTLQGFGAALVPYLPRLIELSRQPEFAYHIGIFATLFASFAPDEPAVRDPLRALLRAAAPGEMADWNLQYSRKLTRQTCAAALLKFNDASLLADFAPLVTDPEADIRRDIVRQLNRFDTPAVEPLVRQALADTDDIVRLRAVEVLTGRAASSDETVAALVQAVEDRVPKVRRAAIDALGKLNVGTDAVLAALAAATEDADTKVAERARITLRKLKPKEPKAKGKKKPK